MHYSEECLSQLHDAQAGFRIHVDSVLLLQPLGFERIMQFLNSLSRTPPSFEWIGMLDLPFDVST